MNVRSAAERRQRLAEDGILLPGQLREQAGERGAAGLVDSTGGNQLINQILNILSAQPRQRHGGNVEHG